MKRSLSICNTEYDELNRLRCLFVKASKDLTLTLKERISANIVSKLPGEVLKRVMGTIDSNKDLILPPYVKTISSILRNNLRFFDKNGNPLNEYLHNGIIQHRSPPR